MGSKSSKTADVDYEEKREREEKRKSSVRPERKVIVAEEKKSVKRKGVSNARKSKTKARDDGSNSKPVESTKRKTEKSTQRKDKKTSTDRKEVTAEKHSKARKIKEKKDEEGGKNKEKKEEERGKDSQRKKRKEKTDTETTTKTTEKTTEKTMEKTVDRSVDCEGANEEKPKRKRTKSGTSGSKKRESGEKEEAEKKKEKKKEPKKESADSIKTGRDMKEGDVKDGDVVENLDQRMKITVSPSSVEMKEVTTMDKTKEELTEDKTEKSETDKGAETAKEIVQQINRKKLDEASEKNVKRCVRAILNKGVSGIKEEFLNLRKETMPSKDECSGFIANTTKNRYKDVPCTDESRVPLKDSAGEEMYIHGNFCGTPNNQKRFICTQGPLESTANDFWQMIWQENCDFIVMLCSITEMGKPKCYEYYPPEEGATITFGDFAITCKKTHRVHWPQSMLLRRLHVKYDDKEREIIHIHWESWPDRGVPPTDKSVFVLLSRVCASANPVVVHCSAGIGRTGSTVLIQNTIDMLESGESLDEGLGEALKQLRKQRLSSVQNDQQYLFVHRMILLYFQVNEDDPKMVKFKEDYEKTVHI